MGTRVLLERAPELRLLNEARLQEKAAETSRVRAHENLKLPSNDIKFRADPASAGRIGDRSEFMKETGQS